MLDAGWYCRNMYDILCLDFEIRRVKQYGCDPDMFLLFI